MSAAAPRARLDGPAGAECRRLCREHLERAAAACRRLADPADAEALHDFRVALRRLRGTLRAFPEPLAGAAGRRWNRRLGRLAAATGDGRDAEVALLWVAARRSDLNWRQRRGLDWYAARLAGRKDRAYAEVLATIPGRFARLAERLSRRLEEPPAAARAAEDRRSEPPDALSPREGDPPKAPAPGGAEAGSADAAGGRVEPSATGAEPGAAAAAPPSSTPPPAGEIPFSVVLAAAARTASTRLVERLGRVRDAGDEPAAHRARIAAKRLRYILEPAVGGAAEAKLAVRALKNLQDLLGELHDAHVLERELAAEAERAARRRARDLLAAAVLADDQAASEVAAPAAGRWDVVGGLVALAGRNRDRRDRLFAQLARSWLTGPETADLAAAVGGLAARLEASAAVAAASESLRDES